MKKLKVTIGMIGGYVLFLVGATLGTLDHAGMFKSSIQSDAGVIAAVGFGSVLACLLANDKS